VAVMTIEQGGAEADVKIRVPRSWVGYTQFVVGGVRLVLAAASRHDTKVHRLPNISGGDVYDEWMPQPDTPTPSDAEALTDVVNRLRRVLRAGIRTDYPWETLPMAQIELLQCLRDHEPAGIRVGEICTTLHLAPATTSGLVQQLVEAGTATRDPDPADRRVAVVRLTKAGRRQLQDWQRAHERRLGTALAQLSVAQRAAVRAAVPALAVLVDKLSQS